MVVDLAQTAGVHTGWTMWGCGLRGRGRAEQSWEEARLREVSFAAVPFAFPAQLGMVYSTSPVSWLSWEVQSIHSLNLGNGRRKEGTPWLPKEARAVQEKASPS